MINDLDKFSTEKYRLAQALIRCYLGSRDGLKELKILRTERNPTGRLRRMDCRRALELKDSRKHCPKGI
jgi:hypothetical protein